MYDVERQEKIIKYISRSNSISVKKLSELLFVSEPTIRRDLTKLEKEGKVLRTHGGVILRKIADNEVSLAFREEKNNVAKKIILCIFLHNGVSIYF